MIELLFGISFFYHTFHTINHTLNYPNITLLSSKIVSSIHSIIISTISFMYLTNYITHESFVYYQFVPISYIIYDLYIISFDPLFKRDLFFTYIHHISFLYCTTLSQTHSTLLAFAYFAELTNPWLYTCWFLVHYNLNKIYKSLFKFCAIFTLITYLLFRVIPLTYFVYYGCFYFRESLFGSIPLCILNYYWFNLLIKKARENN